MIIDQQVPRVDLGNEYGIIVVLYKSFVANSEIRDRPQPQACSYSSEHYDFRFARSGKPEVTHFPQPHRISQIPAFDTDLIT